MSNPVTEEEIRCIGCGAVIQTDNKERSGYVPASVLEKGMESGEVYCQRCFRLRHYNEVQDVELTDDDFREMLSDLERTKALIVYVVDILDFNGSIIPGFHRYIGKNPVILVGNKRDLLPKSLKENRLVHWMKEQASVAGIRPEEVLLTSAVRRQSVQEILEKIESLRKGKDVYVVGVTNVGKSTLINQMISLTTDMREVITTSYFPGTTLGKIEIPLEDGAVMVDTPGIIQPQQMAHFLDSKDLQTIMPKKELKPKTYQLDVGQTLFLGGMARLDVLKGKKHGSFVCYVPNQLPIHRTKTENADAVYERNKGVLLSPPRIDSAKEFPPLKRHEWKIKEKSDIVFAGLGWITVEEPGAVVAAWAAEGAGVFIRKALI